MRSAFRPNNFYASKSAADEQYYQPNNVNTYLTSGYSNQPQYPQPGVHYEQNTNTRQQSLNYQSNVKTSSPFYFNNAHTTEMSDKFNLSPSNTNINNKQNSPLISPTSRYYQPKLLVKHASPSQYKTAEIQNNNYFTDEQHQHQHKASALIMTQTITATHTEPGHPQTLLPHSFPQAPKTRSRKSSLSSTNMPNCFSVAATDIDINEPTHIDQCPAKPVDYSNNVPLQQQPCAKPRVNNAIITSSNAYTSVCDVIKSSEVSAHTPNAKPRVKSTDKSIEAATFFIEVTPRTFVTEVMGSSPNINATTNVAPISPPPLR